MRSVPTFSLAALLIAAVVVLPLASSASAQIAPQPSDSFGFDDTLTTSNTTGTGMSFLIITGASMVEGAEVTGAVMNSEDEISVTMASENETSEPDAVTVVAFAGTMDMMSMFSPGPTASLMNDSGFGNSSIAASDDDDNSELDDYSGDSPSDFLTEDFGDNDTAFAHSMNPMGVFENMKTGSSVVQQGWTSPQSVNVTLVGNTAGAEESDTTFVFVMIFPYTADTTQTVEG